MSRRYSNKKSRKYIYIENPQINNIGLIHLNLKYISQLPSTFNFCVKRYIAIRINEIKIILYLLTKTYRKKQPKLLLITKSLAPRFWCSIPDLYFQKVFGKFSFKHKSSQVCPGTFIYRFAAQ